MLTLAQAEALARQATARRLAADRAARTEARLTQATEQVAARRRRDAAVAAVLRTPQRIPILGIAAWFEQAMQGVPDDDRGIMAWPDWSTP